MAGGGKLNIVVSVFGSEGFLRRISDPAKGQNILSLFIDDMRNDEICMLLEELLLLLMDIQAEAVDHVTLLPHNRT